jgi:Loader and inhibitor of phage G40P
MEKQEALKIVTMVASAYPEWAATEETLRLYVQILMPLDAMAVKRAVMEIIRSPREFAPRVGNIYTMALRYQEQERRRVAERNRIYEPGTVAYTPAAQRLQAGDDGLLHPVPEPSVPDPKNKYLRDWVSNLTERLSMPRVAARRRSGNVELFIEPLRRMLKSEMDTEEATWTQAAE